MQSPTSNGEDEDADPACSGSFEGAGTFGGSGSGSKYIVDEQDSFADDVGGTLEGTD